MNILNILWAAFKYVYLPVGIYFGALYDAQSLSNLSTIIASSVGSMTGLESYSAQEFLAVATAPSALIAWMVPEGGSIVFLAPAAILGQYGMVVAILAFCWFLAPPRFLVANKEEA